jgi:hypothetical protein
MGFLELRLRQRRGVALRIMEQRRLRKGDRISIDGKPWRVTATASPRLPGAVRRVYLEPLDS